MKTFDAITNRHGVLNFDPRPVEKEKIEQVLQAAIAAPSPANTQPWEFVAVTEPDLARKTAAYLKETQAKYVFGAMLNLPADFTAHLMGLYHDFSNAPCFIVLCRHQRVDLAPPEFAAVVRDWDMAAIGAAMGNLMAMATDLGLGTRWFGGLVMDDGGITLKRLLAIPDAVEIVAVTPLGYHREPPKDRPEQSPDVFSTLRRGDKYKLAALLKGKLPLAAVAHFNRFGEKGDGTL